MAQSKTTSNSSNRDVSALMQYASTPSELSKLAIERQQKEDSMKQDGTWDYNWAPTSELFSENLSRLSKGSSKTDSSLTKVLESNLAKSKKAVASAKKSGIAAANKEYDDLARQAYIQKMQNMGSLPAVLASAGHTGGLSETAALAPSVSYGNTLLSIGTSRADTINRINQASDQQALDAAMDFADKIIAQANADRAYNYQSLQDMKTQSYNQYRDTVKDNKDESASVWSRAMQLASYGDFTQLRSLGIDTAEMERMWRKARGF